MNDAADKRVAELERELRGIQEMLALVLLEVGEPVVVSKATMREGLPKGSEIMIEDNVAEDSFVFSLVAPREH